MNEKEPKEQNKNPFQHTLNLPHTDFSIRANSAQKEPELLVRWKKEELCEKATLKNHGKEKFILHDGPPFANGHLHSGHAVNIILKDIVCKIKRMRGYHAPLVQGWDCHGLPIELKVTAEKRATVGKSAEERIAFKKACRDYAAHWIEVQKQELQEMGKLADYDHAYMTMKPSYQADILRALAHFVHDGYIERKNKTVPWCASCQTVLAIAEIEHEDRKDPSLYVLFALEQASAKNIFPYYFEQYPQGTINLLVWTTTPWTLPLNRAVVLNPKAPYVVLAGKENGQDFVVAKERADDICHMLGIEKQIVCECDPIVFEGAKVQHAFIDDLLVPVLLDDMVLVSDGTACLHSAPGCGPEDYVLGIKNGLEIFSPLSHDGCYTVGIKPENFEGMSILDGQIAVIKILVERKRLLHKAFVTHAYPHCWRCKKGLMFRATKQWFCDLQKNNLVERTLQAIESISFIPENGKARLASSVANRTEWCISRQRQWGVPIPALLCLKCDGAYINAGMIRNIADYVAKEGIEYWDRVTIPELIDHTIIKNITCPSCSNSDPVYFAKEHDILDCWFDSGVSHFAVLAKDQSGLGVPADLYLEGSDQHRGWFQSSLLSSMVLHGHAQTKMILTHGYTVDEHKRKMSKSIGNVIAPQDLIKKYSRDILRLWAASVDYEGDMVVSEKFLGNVAETYRKIRNTCRFLISNLYDFDMTHDSVDFDKLLPIDHYALSRLYEVSAQVQKAYDEYHFAQAVQLINHYCVNDLSAQYLDISKDRLYVEKADGLLRRSAQTVLYHILDVLTHLLAPILSFTAEEISDFYQKNKQQSIHLQSLAPAVNIWEVLALRTRPDLVANIERGMQGNDTHFAGYIVGMTGIWNLLEEMRMVVLKSIERLREQSIVKHSLEAKIELHIDKRTNAWSVLENFIKDLGNEKTQERFFKDWFIVSQVSFMTESSCHPEHNCHPELTCHPESCPEPSRRVVSGSLEPTSLDWLRVRASHADGVKCPRCWQWEVTEHAEKLCKRCQDVLVL